MKLKLFTSHMTLALLFIFCATSISVVAQVRECLTVPMDSINRVSNSDRGSMDDFEWWIRSRIDSRSARKKSATYRIPVVVHVVHNGEPLGTGANLSYEQVVSQIEVLNEDFRRLEGSNGFNDDPVGADSEIEFFLAGYDPDNNLMAEPGVDRVNGGRDVWPKGIIQNPIENQLKPTTIWDTEKYLNIWTVNFGGFVGRNLLGYAQFPDMSGLDGLADDEGSAETDGVVVGYKYFGSSGKGDFPELFAPFDLGRTTTHEVGHWLGLRHIWGDGDCSVDDFVEDTPLSGESVNGCPDVEVVTCAIPAMFQNYMDYTDDACMNIFTHGQKERMLAVLENSPRRVELLTAVLSTDTHDLVEFEIFPNPTQNQLNLRLPTEINGQVFVQIRSITGQMVRELSTNSNQQDLITIDLSSLNAGSFLASLYFGDHPIPSVKRFVKVD